MEFRNQSPADRALRISSGACAFYVAWALWPSSIAAASLAIGIVFVVTGAIGWCPIYRLLGISSVRRRRS